MGWEMFHVEHFNWYEEIEHDSESNKEIVPRGTMKHYKVVDRYSDIHAFSIVVIRAFNVVV